MGTEQKNSTFPLEFQSVFTLMIAFNPHSLVQQIVAGFLLPARHSPSTRPPPHPNETRAVPSLCSYGLGHANVITILL